MYTQTELWAIYENNEPLFHTLLQEWCNGEYILCKDNYEDLRDKFIDHAEPDDLENEVDAFGELQGVPPGFRDNYFCLYTEIYDKMFCPSTPDKCAGCERNSPQHMSYIEIIYRKSDAQRVEASYNYSFMGRRKQISLSTCCLDELIDLPSGFYCRTCNEEN